jgi:hypothetical protein
MSSSVPGSWLPNWLQGKPRIVKSSPGGIESAWLNQRCGALDLNIEKEKRPWEINCGECGKDRITYHASP